MDGKACEHVNARAALHDASARVGMFASRMLSLPIVKERLFSTVRKEAVLHYTCPQLVFTESLVKRSFRGARPHSASKLSVHECGGRQCIQ